MNFNSNLKRLIGAYILWVGVLCLYWYYDCEYGRNRMIDFSGTWSIMVIIPVIVSGATFFFIDTRLDTNEYQLREIVELKKTSMIFEASSPENPEQKIEAKDTDSGCLGQVVGFIFAALFFYALWWIGSWLYSLLS